MIERIEKLTTPALVFLVFAAVLASCKELPKNKIEKPRDSGAYFHPIAGNEIIVRQTPGSTGEATPSTSEASVSTEEWGAATSEESTEFATPETAIVARNTRWAYTKDEVNVGLLLKKKTEIVLLPDDVATDEWSRISVDGKTGYVNRDHLCYDKRCIFIRREGIVPVYIMAEEMSCPQVQFEIVNFTETEIENLRLTAKFYYQGEPIGEDITYVASDALGLSPIKPDLSKKVFLRALFNMPKDAVLSPENPVKIELFCAQETFAYAPCGVYYVDSMFY